MKNRFLVTNDLVFLQDHFATAIAQSPLVRTTQNMECSIDGVTVRALTTMEADNLVVVGVAGGHQETLYDLDGLFYITPASWLNPDFINQESSDFKVIEADSILDVSITATQNISAFSEVVL